MKKVQEKTLKLYVRDKKRNPTAVLFARKIDEDIKISWSAVNLDSPDCFSKKRAVVIAEGRLETGTKKFIPHRVSKSIPFFTSKVAKYFSVNPETIKFA